MIVIRVTRNNKPYYLVRWGFHYVDGKRKYQQRGFKTRRAATDFERSILEKPHTRGIRISTLTQRFLDEYANIHTEKRTYNAYRGQIRQRIDPFLGNYQSNDLTVPLIVEWQQWMLLHGRTLRSGERVGVTNTTANNSLRVLKTILRWGRTQGILVADISDVRRLKETSTHKPAPLTPRQINQICKHCQTITDQALIKLLAYSGLRWSEAIALEWADIDWHSNTITVSKSLDVDRTLKTTKSNRIRTTALLAEGASMLRAYYESLPYEHPRVFVNNRGGYFGGNWHERTLPHIVRESGIVFTPHNLRDTYASLLIAAGVDIPELTLLLGHSSVDVTLRHYGAIYEERRAHRAHIANDLVRDMLA